jgi:hypothetical protein
MKKLQDMYRLKEKEIKDMFTTYESMKTRLNEKKKHLNSSKDSLQKMKCFNSNLKKILLGEIVKKNS